jgi:Fur family transcriptional regulator, ferric uptake regulator
MSESPRRMTPQRAEILAELQAAHDHPTAAELHERLRRRLPRLSLGTVYRNLDVLATEGQVAKLVGVGAGAEARYDGTAAPHDHARCRSCGVVADIPAPAAEGAPGLPEGFVVERRRLEYIGVCASCRTAGRTGAH